MDTTENIIKVNPQKSLRKRILWGFATLIIGSALTIWISVSMPPDIADLEAGSQSMFHAIPYVYGIAVIYGTFRNILGDSKNTFEESQSQVIDNVEIDYWLAYGQRLKNAYNSKFGYVNPAFNQEVDAHVSVMLNNGRGFTRALAKDWLIRMHSFTESK